MYKKVFFIFCERRLHCAYYYVLKRSLCLVLLTSSNLCTILARAQAALLPPGEFKECRQKRLNPEVKIYQQRTIEVGIVVDMFLWQNMKVGLWLTEFYFYFR